jgi:import receptor subunit TOM70
LRTFSEDYLESIVEMSDSSFSHFVQRNKLAIIGAVGAVSVGLLASYYYLQAAQEETGAARAEAKEEPTEAKKSKKKKKKASKSSAANAEAEASVAKETRYLVDAQGLPQLTEEFVSKLTPTEKEEIAIDLKVDGNEYFGKQEYEKAIPFYTAALELKEDPIFYSNRSACYVGLEKFDKVVEDTTAALKLKPDYTKCLLRRSNAYEHLEKYEDSMFDLTALTVYGGFNNQTVEQVLDRVLKKHSYKIVEQRLQEQQVKIEKGENENLPSPSSISSFFAAFDKETPEGFNIPESPAEGSGDFYLRTALTEVSKSEAESFTKADSLFTKAVEAYKKEVKEATGENPSLNEKLAVSLEYAGIFQFLKLDPLNALSSIQLSIQIFPRSRAYIFQGLILADKQEFDEAQNLFAKAIELNPKSAEIFYHKAQLYYLRNELKDARENFEKSKELNLKNVYPYIQLACIEYREGNFEKAEETFKAAKKLFPTSPEIPNYYGEILGDKGDISGSLKQFDVSFKLQEALLPKISVGVIPLVNKATVLTRDPSPENLKLAAETLETAIKIDSKSELALVTLAQLRLQENKVEEAVDLFERAALLSRSLDEKLQATSFAEASKIQLKVKNDPVLSKKINEYVAQYGAQGLA